MTLDLVSTPPSTLRFALLRGAPADEDVAVIREQGYGVRVIEVPPGETTLDYLSPLAPFVTDLSVMSGRVRDARFVESMTHLRDLSIGVDTDFDVDVTKIPGLLRFGGEFRHLKYALAHPNIREIFLESFPLAEVPFISAPVEKLRINNARKLTRLPVLASPETLVELLVDSARSLSVAGVSGYPNLQWLLLDSCQELIDTAAITRAPNLRKLTLIDCVNLDNIDALLDLENVEISVGGRHPFSEEFRRRTALTGCTWSFPPGRRYYVPPEKRKRGARAAKLYLIHPGLARPLSVPDEASEDTPWRDALTDEWEKLNEPARVGKLGGFLIGVLRWARAEGADRVEIAVAPYGEDNVDTTTLTNQTNEELANWLMNLSAFTVLAGDRELAKVWETVEEGVIVHTAIPSSVGGIA